MRIKMYNPLFTTSCIQPKWNYPLFGQNRLRKFRRPQNKLDSTVYFGVLCLIKGAVFTTRREHCWCSRLRIMLLTAASVLPACNFDSLPPTCLGCAVPGPSQVAKADAVAPTSNGDRYQVRASHGLVQGLGKALRGGRGGTWGRRGWGDMPREGDGKGGG